MRFTTLRHPVVAFRRARVLPQWVRRIDRAVNRSINASPSWHLRDRGYRRLSRAADHGGPGCCPDRTGGAAPGDPAGRG